MENTATESCSQYSVLAQETEYLLENTLHFLQLEMF